MPTDGGPPGRAKPHRDRVGDGSVSSAQIRRWLSPIVALPPDARHKGNALKSFPPRDLMGPCRPSHLFSRDGQPYMRDNTSRATSSRQLVPSPGGVSTSI